jgi:hypothetical protein
MKKFPEEFSDLLNKKGQHILSGKYKTDKFKSKKNTPVDVLSEVIDEKAATDCIRILQKNFYPLLRPIASRIDPEELINMKKNYSEKLAKNLRMKTLEIGGKNSRSFESAAACGLYQMMHSASLQKFGEMVAGEPFGVAQNNQIICYESGDYVSPHNDHHPEFPSVKDGFFDIHIMFSNAAVQHQLLVYENNGYLNGYYNIAVPVAIAVYKLPFWHYTTPLVPKQKKESTAQRWLLLRSFETAKPAKHRPGSR